MFEFIQLQINREISSISNQTIVTSIAYFGFNSNSIPAKTKLCPKIAAASSSEENSTKAVPENNLLSATWRGSLTLLT